MTTEEKQAHKEWGSAKDVQATFGIGRTPLNGMVERKEVRKRKIGAGKKSGVVYNFEDIRAYLERISE